jgi:hypothetical protein
MRKRRKNHIGGSRSREREGMRILSGKIEDMAKQNGEASLLIY